MATMHALIFFNAFIECTHFNEKFSLFVCPDLSPL